MQKVYILENLIDFLMAYQGGIAKTIMTGAESAVILGFIDNGTGQHQSNTVYSTNGLSPAITTIDGGGTQQIKILVENNNE